jgi:hypothetical protein
MNSRTTTHWSQYAPIFALAGHLASAPGTIGATRAVANSDSPVEKITPHLSVARGPVNGVLVGQDGRHLAVYGWPNAEPARIDQVLITHRNR